MVSGLSYGAGCPSISMQERMYSREMKARAEANKVAVIDGNNTIKLTKEEISEYMDNGMITELCGIYYAI